MPEKLKKYYETQAALEKLKAELENLNRDESLKADLAVRTEVQAILEKYSRQPKDLLALFNLGVSRGGEAPVTAAPKGKTRKPRALKVYLNPHTGELVKTRGANHTVLKGWKAKYGAAQVETWLQ
jgi:hypothetical protein